ncbi:MAG: hypothetical protein WBA62_17220 [Xanthobacteraceae bacterium]
MIRLETDHPPEVFEFDYSIVAVGYERRCRWVTEQYSIRSKRGCGLEFGFLKEGSYAENIAYFKGLGFDILDGLQDNIIDTLASSISASADDKPSIFVDISSMSREMIANVVLSLQKVRAKKQVSVTTAYAPSKFTQPYDPAPIRIANPIKPHLAGWSSRPETPLGTIFGLGCEPGLALGALQILEPNKTWIFRPKGIDPKFDGAMKKANEHIEDIFDISAFTYHIAEPTAVRGRLEALLNAIDGSFRLIVVPFGPKIFAWLAICTVLFGGRSNVGVWTFSSKEDGKVVDREAEGHVIWHAFSLNLLETAVSS